MSYVVIKNPAIRIDLVVKKEYLPQLVGYISRMGCTYEAEQDKDDWVCLMDISGPTGRHIGDTLGLFYSLEWGHLVEGKPEDKFYILLNMRRKKAKKNVHKNRKEADQGSDGGNSGESAGYSEPGPVDGPAGNWDDTGAPCDDDLWESPRIE